MDVIGSRQFLMTVWDGGGNTPPEFGVARRLVERGHKVHVLGDPTLALAAEGAGCRFSSWTSAPHRTTLDVNDDLLRDWEAEDALDVLRRMRDQIMCGPASGFAADTAAGIKAVQPDAVLADGNLFGSVIAAEEARLPIAVLIPNLWSVPTPGTGDRAVLALMNRVVNGGLSDLNAARRDHGLAPLNSSYDQILGADRVLVLASETFDHAAAFVPSNVRYVGPVLDDPSWVEPWESPWPESNVDPLVVVGFSSGYQEQRSLTQRAIDALSSMQVRGLVLLGQVLDPDEFDAGQEVFVVRSAPHNEVLRLASVAVTHCGHGTTMKALAAGVPMVCVPMGRDQDVNAEGVVRLEAGVRLLPTASSADIRLAVKEVLDNDGYRSNALRLASTLADEHQPLDAVVELESLVGLAA